MAPYHVDMGFGREQERGMSCEDPQSIKLQEWRSWSEEIKARRWLADNVRRAHFRRLKDRELLQCLRELPEQEDRVALLDVLCDRVEEGSTRFQRSVGDIIESLAEVHPGPGRDAVAVDHAIQRLLHRLPQPIGGRVAAASLRSPRRRRKTAAWKYYHRNELDDVGRELLASEFGIEDSEEYRKLLASDPELVRRLGVEAVLSVAPNRYWRTRAIEAVLVIKGDAGSLRESYPAEWLWAVARLHDRDQLAQVLALLEGDDLTVDIVNRVLLCVMDLGDGKAIDRALEAAELLLEADPPAKPQPWDNAGD